ncbi:MAG TPA: hypothetical protein VHX65_11435 [Pirellulales bacterium]|nr:hypothetical protein [Pirellulales bacterium]
MVGLLASLGGCSPAEKIEQYTVEKPDVLAEKYFHESPDAVATNGPGTDRMVAAVVPHGSQFWFFKLAGPDEAVAKQAAPFLSFMSSIHFADGAESPPDWTLPEGWTRQPGNAMRFATIEITPGPPRLEVSVSMLSKPPEAAAAQGAVLQNVNRWRGQLGLKPIAGDQLAKETKTVDIGGETATLVNLVGKLRGGMMMPPFAGGALPPGHPVGQAFQPDGSAPPPAHPELPPDHPAITPDQTADSTPPPAESSPDLKYETPAGWEPGQLNEMRKAAFEVKDGPQEVAITVVALPPFAGDLLPNVNRWRGQLHLPPITADDLSNVVKPMSIGGAPGSYVNLTGPADPAPQQTILGAMAATADRVWFVKLQGDTKLAEREKPKFESFLKSLKFAGQ